MTIWRMRIACWIPNATTTHSEYVTLIAFQCKNAFINVPHYYITSTLLPCYKTGSVFTVRCELIIHNVDQFCLNLKKKSAIYTE